MAIQTTDRIWTTRPGSSPTTIGEACDFVTGTDIAALASASAPVQSVNGNIGVVVLSAIGIGTTPASSGPGNGQGTTQGYLDALNGETDDLRQLSGASYGASDFGVFTGTIIPNASTAKAALQALETALEAQPANVSANAGNDITVGSDGGAFFAETLTTLTYNGQQLAYRDELGVLANIDLRSSALYYLAPASGPANGQTTVKGALDALNTEHLNAGTLSGVGVGATTLGAFPGSIIPDGASVKGALQSLEAAVAAQPANVSGDAGNDITVGSDGGAFFAETLTTLSYASPTLSYQNENGVTNTIALGAAALQYVSSGVGALSGLGTSTVAAGLDALGAETDRVRSVLGNVSTDTHMGTFPGSVIPDNVSVKGALQSLEAAIGGITETAVTVSDDNIVNLTAGGTNGHAIAASLDISAVSTAVVSGSAGNSLGLGGDGRLFFNEQAVTVSDDNIVNLTAGGAKGHAIAASLDIGAVSTAVLSGSAGNSLGLGGDGRLFFNETALTVTDDNIVNLTATGTKGHQLNAAIDMAALVTALAANAAFRTAINSIITSRFSWDGTKLCFDYNNNGNPST